jgi:hypothetical protein
MVEEEMYLFLCPIISVSSGVANIGKKEGKMTIEEIENDLNRGIYLNNYSNVEQAISFLLSEIKRLRELYLDADNDRYTESHKRMAREAEVKRLREGIEKHKSKKVGWGIRLYLEDEELYKLL